MCEVYRLFARDWEHVCAFGDAEVIELYNHESHGTPLLDKRPHNGFVVGKRWLNVNVAMWLEDIQLGFLTKSELYEDGRFPAWWLDKVLNRADQS